MMKRIALVLGSLAVATAHYNSEYHGKATFYGEGGSGEKGACMLARGFNDVGLTVAINGPMWDNAQNCGKCIRLVGTGVGTGTTPVLGPIYATIDNVCPECKYGDIDLGLDGDGIWKMSWDFIDCSEARSNGSILPIKGRPQNDPVRRLRADGTEETSPLPLAGLYLAPGQYVTPEGVKSVEEVKAASQVIVV